MQQQQKVKDLSFEFIRSKKGKKEKKKRVVMETVVGGVHDVLYEDLVG